MTPEQIAALSAPLNKSAVKKNPRGFDYIEGWRAIEEANRIFGFDGWDRITMELTQLGEPELVGQNWRVAYRGRVRIIVRDGDKEITRDGTGYGSGIGKDIRDVHESATKECETDAMKRALMTFGNPFGLALYDKAQANVVTDPPKKAAPSNADEALCRYADQVLETVSKTPADELRPMWDGVRGELKRMGVTQTDDPIYVQLKEAFAKRHEATAQMEAA